MARGGRPPLDDHLDAIGHETRRDILYRLDAADADWVRVDELRPGADSELALHHVHLPKLERMWYVETTDDTTRVRPGPRFDDLVPLLSLLSEYGSSRDPRCR